MKTKITILAIILALSVCSIDAQVMVKDISKEKDSSYIRGLTNINGTLYFIEPRSGLWKSDGTDSGTVVISKKVPENPNTLTNVNDILYFFAESNQYLDQSALWKYDSRSKSPAVTVKEVLGGKSNFNKLTSVNGVLFFCAPDRDGGISKLWKSDGTAKGTVIVSSPSAQDFGNLININNTLFFTSWDPTHGEELWKTDGTAAGTVIVKDINAVYTSTGDSEGSKPMNLFNVNGTLFFTADDGIHGRELWKSNGTEAGTAMVKDIEVGSNSPFSNAIYGASFTNVNGILFFSLRFHEIWKSDGTANGTVKVKAINPEGPSFPYELTNVNGTLFFAANDGIHGVELWKSNGTAARTVMVKDINIPSTDRRQYANSTGSIAPLGKVAEGSSLTFTNVNGVLYFSANDGTHGAELWKSDGTATGTLMVKDIKPFGNFGSEPRNLIYINGVLFFTADDGPHGNELWKYDVPAK